MSSFNKTIYYQAVGELISGEQNPEVQMKYITNTVQPMMVSWQQLLASGSSNEEYMRLDDT